MQLPHDESITYFAETDARNKRVKFGIKAKDRTKHVYVIGKTGMGKSTLLENMAAQDIQNGEGMAFIDPHGKTADLLLEYIPKDRIKDVIYFAPFDLEHPISFNVLENVDPDKRHLVVSGLMSTFKKIWEDAWSARMEYILTNTLLALLEYPDATLLGVNRMLSDKAFRQQVVSHITDPSVKSFWVDEFANYTERMAAEAVPAIQNKVGQFTANPLIRNMIGQPRSSFDIREIMDNRKIMIINLSKGRIGESNANLLGGMMITKIYLAAMSRADLPDRVLKTMPNFYLFVDEFQNFANESFADILSEARKYKLNLTIAHQYIEQMEEEVRAAVFGNVGTMIVFRVGAYDAEVLEKEFAPTFTMEDIVNLGIYQIYLKLMINGVSSQPFSAATLVPIPQATKSYVQEVLASSREQFAHNRADVEQEVVDWMQPMKPPPKGAGKATNGATGGTGAPPTGSGGQLGAPSTPARPVAPATRPTTSVTQSIPSTKPIPPAAPKAPVSPASKPAPVPTPSQAPTPNVFAQAISKERASSPALSDLLKKVTAEKVEKLATAPAVVPAPAASASVAPATPISLSKLTPRISPAGVSDTTQKLAPKHFSKDTKTQTPQNVSNLKAALDAAMKQKSAGAGVGVEKVDAPKTEKTENKKVENKSEKVSEVPKEVLEKVLRME